MTNLANLPIPIEVLYAGLGGTVLALIVATIQQNWSCRVFFLLALRLAIGWQFLFEGLYKVESHMAGPHIINSTEMSRPFSSEGYFRQAPGPVGAYMRKQFANPATVIDGQVKPGHKLTPAEFAKLTPAEQAGECPAPVAQQLDEMVEKATEAVKGEAAKSIVAADAAEKKVLDDPKSTDEQKANAKAASEAARQAARQKEGAAGEIAKDRVSEAKAKYAGWVFGTNPRLVKLNFISGRSLDLPDGQVMIAAPERLEHLDWLRKQVNAADAQIAAGLGNGNGTEQKRMAALRTDLITAESELAKDSKSFVADLKKGLNGGTAVEEPKTQSRGQLIDKVTMWMLVGVGFCLMAGLFTRLACLLGVGFLVMTYLAYPPFPWYPLPPNTEGNPVFVNKNAIEALALMALACMPTGKWMGIDALISRIFRRGSDAPA